MHVIVARTVLPIRLCKLVLQTDRASYATGHRRCQVLKLLVTTANSGHSLFSDPQVTPGAQKTCLPTIDSR